MAARKKPVKKKPVKKTSAKSYVSAMERRTAQANYLYLALKGVSETFPPDLDPTKLLPDTPAYLVFAALNMWEGDKDPPELATAEESPPDQLAKGRADIKMKDVASDNVRSVGHDPKGKVLRVHFRNGGLYEYTGVDSATFAQLQKADSIGRFLHRQIKDEYPCERVN